MGSQKHNDEGLSSDPFHDPDWEPPTVVPPEPSKDPVIACFERLESGITSLKASVKAHDGTIDTLLQDLRSLRLSLEQRFNSIETRLTNVEKSISEHVRMPHGVHDSNV